MSEQARPDNFDWVAARKKCSVMVVMESLLAQTRCDVEAMAVTDSKGQTTNRFSFTSNHRDQGFAVTREGFEKAGARFWVGRQDRIFAETFGRSGPPQRIEATLTLNEHGNCRLLVGQTQLQEWQFLKLVLESLFFNDDLD